MFKAPSTAGLQAEPGCFGHVVRFGALSMQGDIAASEYADAGVGAFTMRGLIVTGAGVKTLKVEEWLKKQSRRKHVMLTDGRTSQPWHLPYSKLRSLFA